MDCAWSACGVGGLAVTQSSCWIRAPPWPPLGPLDPKSLLAHACDDCELPAGCELLHVPNQVARGPNTSTCSRQVTLNLQPPRSVAAVSRPANGGLRVHGLNAGQSCADSADGIWEATTRARRRPKCKSKPPRRCHSALGQLHNVLRPWRVRTVHRRIGEDENLDRIGDCRCFVHRR